MWDDEIEPVVLYQLSRAYMRRKLWEAGGKPKGQTQTDNVTWVTPDEILSRAS